MTDRLVGEKNGVQLEFVKRPFFKLIVRLYVGHEPTRNEYMEVYSRLPISFLYRKWFNLTHYKQLHVGSKES